MKPLQTNREVLVWLGTCSPFEVSTQNKRLSQIIFALVNILTNALFVLASGSFFMKFAAIDLEESLYAVFQIFAALPVQNTVIAWFFLKQRVKALFMDLSKIYDECKRGI